MFYLYTIKFFVLFVKHITPNILHSATVNSNRTNKKHKCILKPCNYRDIYKNNFVPMKLFTNEHQIIILYLKYVIDTETSKIINLIKKCLMIYESHDRLI